MAAHGQFGFGLQLDSGDYVFGWEGNGKCLKCFGGPGEIRTHDLFHAMEARSQLRHRPTCQVDSYYITAPQFNGSRHAIFEHADVPQIAIILRVIETVAHHKLVGNLKSYVSHLHRPLPPFRFVQQRRNPQ
jgi:hypothetical protein